VSDGTRLTNFVSINGSNGTLADVNLQRGSLSNALNITEANFGLSNGTMVGVSNLSGRVCALTNGTYYSNIITRSLISNSCKSARQGLRPWK